MVAAGSCVAIFTDVFSKENVGDCAPIANVLIKHTMIIPNRIKGTKIAHYNHRLELVFNASLPSAPR